MRSYLMSCNSLLFFFRYLRNLFPFRSQLCYNLKNFCVVIYDTINFLRYHRSLELVYCS